MKKINTKLASRNGLVTYGLMVDWLRQPGRRRAWQRKLAAAMIENLCAEIDALRAKVEDKTDGSV